MRVIQYHEFGGPDVLQFERIDEPTPAPDEVLIETGAIGVNPCDSLRREGLWDDELPLIPGSDAAGIVKTAGNRVTRFNVGDRVYGTIPHLNVSGTRGDRQGTYADHVVAREERLATLPDGVSFEIGAGVGLVGITAWRALLHFGELEPGQTCLVHGGSGGVGHVAVQLASDILLTGRRRPVVRAAFFVSLPVVIGIAAATNVLAVVGLIVVGGFFIQLGIGVFYTFGPEFTAEGVTGPVVAFLTTAGLLGSFADGDTYVNYAIHGCTTDVDDATPGNVARLIKRVAASVKTLMVYEGGQVKLGTTRSTFE